MTESEDPGPDRPSLEVLVTDEQPIRLSHEALVRALTAGCRALDPPDGATLSLTLVTPDAISELKRESFGVEEATDILSFPIDGFAADAVGGHVIGDLVLAPEVAIRQGAGLGRDGDEEILELLAHGLLHLAGRDHADPDTEVAMALEQRTLAETMRRGAA
jgi:probable rRNA maturation factor